MEKFNKKVYLAGAVSFWYENKVPSNAMIWREKASKYFRDNCDIKCFNPCNENPICWDYDQSGVIYQNYFYLCNSDIVLVNLEKLEESPGTIWELAIAWQQHKLVVGFGNSKWKDKPHIKSMININFDALEEAVMYIADMFIE